LTKGFPPFARTVLIVALAMLLGGPLALLPSNAAAQDPDPTRPHLHLPFLGGAGYEVTCGYGCYQHQRSMYYAVDFDLPADAPIVAAADGTVMAITWELGLPMDLNLGDALVVYIDHGGGWFTRYVHLSGITVQVGDQVHAGQIIGYGGATGAARAHLHFELKRGESLHSPSQPLDDLFGGPPEAGQRYVSDNVAPSGAGLAAAPTVEPPGVPTPGAPPIALLGSAPAFVSPVPTVPSPPSTKILASGPQPRVTAGLTLSPTMVAFGGTITASFTVRNDGSEPAHFAVLGVGGREPGGRLTGGALLFARDVTIPPGGEHRFEGSRTITVAGELELFVFALASDSRFWPLPAVSPDVPILARLSVAPRQYELFLPSLSAAQSPPSGP